VREVEEPKENIELAMYLEESKECEAERRDLFRLFSKSYSLD